jgi:hypothetical protein
LEKWVDGPLPISILLIVDFISGLLKMIIEMMLATKPNSAIIVKSTPRIMKFANSSFPTKKKHLNVKLGFINLFRVSSLQSLLVIIKHKKITCFFLFLTVWT